MPGLDVEVGSGEVHVNSSAVFDLLYAQAFWRSLPLQLALTTAGARMQCTDDDCRLANTLTATADCVLSLLLLVYLPRSLRRHQAAVARRVNHARVTVADYSVELLGLRPNVTPEEVVELVRRRLVQHAEARAPGSWRGAGRATRPAWCSHVESTVASYITRAEELGSFLYLRSLKLP